MNIVSLEEACNVIQSGNRVFIQGASATPQQLIKGMVAQANRLRNVEIVHIHTEGDASYTKPEYAESFYTNVFFIAKNTREAIPTHRADYVPIFLSEVPLLFRRKILPLEVALIQVSPPDKHGNCSLGPSVDVTLSAVQSAKYVIAQVNPKMPRTFGDGVIHHSKIHFGVEVDEPLITHEIAEPDPIEQQIGNHVATLVEDGATLQMGIGAIPNAVLKALVHHKGLGVHTEMFSDGIIDLVEKGVITGEHKAIHRNKIVSGFALGSQRLLDFMHDNPSILMLDSQYVNDTANIRRNPKVTAINSAIEVDLTGQVCADSIGTRMYSGVGGQMDFIRGASLSEGGKPIIALPSVTSKGESRISAILKPGAGVVTTRAHVHYVVTEYGIAYLYGKNLEQRAKALINIAHPDHREYLSQKAKELWG